MSKPDDRDRDLGATSFVSADVGTSSRGDFNGPPDAGGEGEGEDDRTVEEGDIYRVLASGLIANLNAYRGLQLIDVSDPDHPAIVGRAQISGYPVELYERDGVVYVLMNDWSGYWGSRYSASVEGHTGGVVAAIDVREPSAPFLLEQAYVPGSIIKSRMTRGSAGAALYVAASDYAEVEIDGGTTTWAARTVVRSFDITDDTLAEAGALDLGGFITDIQATTEALLVARTDWNRPEYTSTVALVDISDPHGAMVLGDEVEVAGIVANQFNMDLRGGVLRVVSGSTWSGTQTNHVETFDASDLSSVLPIDSATFGDGQQLFATLFLDDAGFFVTYLRVDPFHAFAIGADGTLTEHGEFVVSGWNDFFRAALDDTRLIGIGTNDEANRRTMSVSLYDVTDLTNPTPLVARADVDVEASWSEASWDHRAFSVIEDAVSVPAGDVTETGLVLLPYQGWDSEAETYTTAVQLFTFSSTTLTRRGVMPHGTPVRRSFLADDALAANLSDESLSLYDTAAPDTPVARGRLDLAPNYVDVFPLADGYRARVNGSADYYWSWWGAAAELPPNAIEVIGPGAHPDTAAALASIALPATAVVYASGTTLVAVDTRILDTTVWPYATESDVRVYDLSDPLVPVLASSFTTDRIQSSWYGWWGVEDCFDCGGWWYAPSSDVHALPGALAFLSRHPMQESVGNWEYCTTYPTYQEQCEHHADGTTTCTTLGGGVYCARPVGEPEADCSGTIERCTWSYDDDDGSATEYACVAVDAEDVETTRSCATSERYRYWTRLTVDVLDLRDPAATAFAPVVELPEHDEGVSALVDDATLWLAFLRPADVDGDSAPYVRWFARPIGLDDPAAPHVGPAINVPGELLAVDGDTATTRDWLWADDTVESSVHQLALDVDAGVATLTASHRFVDRYVSEVKLDGAGHVLVVHRSTSWGTDEMSHLAVLSPSLAKVAGVEVDTWATLKDGVAGRALFQVPGGLLVMNLDDASAPYAQAFFALRGWPTAVRVEGRDVVIPAGRYGIYRFDLDEENLLGP